MATCLHNRAPTAMSDTTFQERRRVPRHTVGAGATLDLHAMLNVQVREISVPGLLLVTPEPLDVGTRGILHMTLSGTPLQLEVQVQRVAPTRFGGPGFDVGARFIGISSEQRQLIERFIRH